MAELGMVAASWGTVLVSGSGVLVVGEVGGGLSKVRGLLLLPGLGPLFFGNFKGSADLDGVEVGWGIRILGVRPRFFPGLRPLCPG